MKKALITGITGQDGSYLADHLLELGYEVHGLVRHSSVKNTKRIEHIIHSEKLRSHFILHDGDLTDPFSLLEILKSVGPCEIYNLAAQSHVKISYSVPEFTSNVNAIGPLRILEAARILGWESDFRFYQASTSELFGESESGIYDETTPLAPNNPYAISKLYAYWTARYYRETYKNFVSNGFLFSHESPRRGENFVSRKIVMSVARIVKGSPELLKLGNLEVQRDWGHARDFVRGIHSMLAHETPTDFVLATGKVHSLRKFTELAFEYAGMEIEWSGVGLSEIAVLKSNGRKVIEVDSTYFRPNLELVRWGDSGKAKRMLGWEASISFDDLVCEMITHELTTV